MAINAKEMTAPKTSVGADERQSIQSSTKETIPAKASKINDLIKNSQEDFEKAYQQMRACVIRHIYTRSP